jgi:hypothetical protein
MTDNTNTTSKSPSHAAYQVRNREGKKSIWTRIGTAWAHADGKGFTSRSRLYRSTARLPCASFLKPKAKPYRAGFTARPSPQKGMSL